MGWLFSPGQTRSELIARLTQGWNAGADGNGPRVETIAHTTRGNVLWTVHERQSDGARWIGCYLMEDRGGWGYKDMTEADHPYYYSCPLAYLDLAPVQCEKWREGVRAYHARRSQPLTVGQTVTLRAGCRPPTVRVISLRPLRGVYGGAVYRIPRSMLADPETVPTGGDP